MTKYNAGKTCLNHVEVAAADSARCHANEFTSAIGDVLLDDGDGSLCGSNSEHAFTVVVNVCYVVVGAIVLVVLDVDDVLDELVDVVVDKLVELVGAVVIDEVVVVAAMM